MWFQPRPEDLATLISDDTNTAIGRACGVSEQTVRNWLRRFDLTRRGRVGKYGQELPEELVRQLRQRARKTRHQRATQRLTSARVSEVIAAIGKRAEIIVRAPDPATGRRIKYAGAHDLRRSLANRLIDAGVSAESLMVIMRHQSYATTIRHYGGRRGAQSAASEASQRLATIPENSALVGGFVGGHEQAPRLSAEELVKRKSLLAGV